MITFLCVFDNGNVVPVQKEMTLTQSKIWAKDQVRKYSHLIRVEIKENVQLVGDDLRNIIYNQKSWGVNK